MGIDSKSLKADALGNLYRSALFMVKGQIKLSLDFFKKAHKFCGDKINPTLPSSLKNENLQQKSQQLYWAEKILDQYHFLKNSSTKCLKRKSWSTEVTKHSIALDLEEGVFTWDNPKKIAASLKNSAENSLRRKATPFKSAMSMLNFYINRAGKNLPEERKKILEQAKIELRNLFRR